ncbi:cystathionine gamma-lyase-like [Anticarsia gemmatalis]|uniref:cystathionine gamma-lyase-like n=1 Tax=Anticarsia gemmatalis TaxID=129554 RepID=UPI003F7600EC
MRDHGFLKPRRGFATTAIHSGQDPEKWSGAVIPPIVTSTTFKRSVRDHNGYIYGRSGNPTRQALEECLAKLDGGKYGMAFSSGLAATTTIVSLLRQGDHIISSDDLYGGTSRLFRDIIKGLGIEVTFADCTKAETLAREIKSNTKMVWVETPTNPILRVLDIAGICQLVKSFGSIMVVVDNTFLTPYLQRPLDFGADIVMYSLTKYMNGHSDVVMGAAIVNNDDIAIRLRFLQKAMGAVPSPIDCYLVTRSLKTLSLRMEHHKKSSVIIAQWLKKHPKVTEVLHPGLPDHPQYNIAKRQTSGHSGVFSFRHTGGINESEALLSSLKVFTSAESLGGFESLAELPSTMTHLSVPDEKKAELGITDDLIRLSVGLEDIEDLVEDLDQAFKKAFSSTQEYTVNKVPAD